uniref:(northern house mosquito) hypothetical protein n=1 Tax=Culex pipiens TaxID=7175 RepID=A0A8D8BSB7_CULPI
MFSNSGIAFKHSSAMNGARSGTAAASSADAIVIPTPFRFDSAFNDCSTFGNFRKAFFVSIMTARGVLILIRCVSWGYAFPRVCFHSIVWHSSSCSRWASLPRLAISLGSEFWYQSSSRISFSGFLRASALILSAAGYSASANSNWAALPFWKKVVLFVTADILSH